MKNDSITPDGAKRLAEKIQAYWAKQGHEVKVNFVPGSFMPSLRSGRTDIRSDMRNGMPRRVEG